MKKIFAMLFVLIMITSTTACSNKEKSKGFSGTWQISCIEYEGSKFTVDEWKTMEDEDLSEFYIILKEGGKAYIYDDGYGDLVDWLKSEDSIMIGDEKCDIVDGNICLDYYGDKIYLQKTSDNQEITKDDKSDDNENEDTEDVEDTDYDTSDDANWKQFLKDYEAWVDDYIVVLKKYKENPTDASILSDYSEMVSEMVDWSDKADEIELELEDTDAALEYSAELLRIAGKLSEAAY